MNEYMTLRLVVICAFSFTLTRGWSSHFPSDGRMKHLVFKTRIMITGDDSEVPLSGELETFNDPCWQNMLDDDCSMGNIYAANFVASKWIKSMPCGEGIEDCDMPTELTSPDARHESGVDNIDVMKVLGLKRAESINTKP